MTEGDAAARRGKEALSLSGGHLCHACGHQYPNPNPSAKLRRSHRRNCPTRERNAAEGPGPLVLGGSVGGLGDGDGPGNGAASGSASPGSAEGGGDLAGDKENTDEGNVTNLAKPCSNGVQHKVPKTSTGIAPLAVAHPAEREDSFDEYQDASSFLQSDPEDGAAVAHESDISTEIKNLDKGSVGTSVDADVISVKINAICKSQFSREPSMPDFPAGSKVENEDEGYLKNITHGLVAHEDGLILRCTDECSADTGSNDTDVVVDKKSDEISGNSEFIGDLNASSLQKCSPLMPDPESQSACSMKEDSFLKDGMHVLESMSDVSPRVEGSDDIGSETISNSGTKSVPTGDELKLSYTENASADCSTERSSQNLSVQLPVDNSCLLNSACSVPGYQNDIALTNADGMLKSITEDNYSKGISVMDSELDSSCKERPQQDVEQIITVAEGNTFIQKHNGVCTEEVCNQESDTEVPTKYQVSSSQEHVILLMDQVSSIKNPFNLDDTRSEDLFELSSGSYHFEEPNVVESKQQFDSTTMTVSSMTSDAGGQHCPTSDNHGHMLAVSSENGYAVGVEDVLVSCTADPMKTIFLHDASVNYNNQEGESHTNGTSCVLSQAFPTEFATMPVSQEINELSTHVGEEIETEDTDANDATAVHTADNFEEKKQTEDASAKELNSVLHTEYAEEEKLAEDNGAKEAGVVRSIGTVHENNQGQATGSKEVRAEKMYTEFIHEKGQSEESSAEKMDTEFNADDADNRQTDGIIKEQMYEVQPTNNTEEKKQAKETGANEKNTVEVQKQDEGTVGLEGNRQNAEIATIGSRLNSARISVPLKVLLAEASLESKEKKPSTKERVLSFRRRPSLKDDTSSAKPGLAGSDDQYWNPPARLHHNDNVDKRSKVRKQPWMPFICCHSVH